MTPTATAAAAAAPGALTFGVALGALEEALEALAVTRLAEELGACGATKPTVAMAPTPSATAAAERRNDILLWTAMVQIPQLSRPTGAKIP